jgi:hypothetical protein
VWRIHGASSKELLFEILDSFAIPASDSALFSISPEDPSDGCVVALVTKCSDIAKLRFRFPALRETMNAQQVAYATKYPDLPEYAGQYMVMYALSMFARYRPDVWIRCIDSHCKSAVLIQKAIALCKKKFPIMMLALLADEDIIVSTHRAPWHI